MPPTLRTVNAQWEDGKHMRTVLPASHCDRRTSRLTDGNQSLQVVPLGRGHGVSPINLRVVQNERLQPRGRQPVHEGAGRGVNERDDHAERVAGQDPQVADEQGQLDDAVAHR